MCDTVHIGAVCPLLWYTGHCGRHQTRAFRVDRSGATTHPRSLESTRRSWTLARCVEKMVQPGFLCIGVPFCLCRKQEIQSELVPFYWVCKPASSKIHILSALGLLSPVAELSLCLASTKPRYSYFCFQNFLSCFNV